MNTTTSINLDHIPSNFYVSNTRKHIEEFLERMANPKVLHKRFRIDVTELTALTWLPKLVKLIEENYPRLILEPQVELSSVLFDKMSDDLLDFIIVPDIHEDARFKVQPLGSGEMLGCVLPITQIFRVQWRCKILLSLMC